MATPAWLWPLIVIIVFVILTIVFFVLYHRSPNNKFYLAIAVISLIITVAAIIWLLYAITAKHPAVPKVGGSAGRESASAAPIHSTINLSEL